MKVSIIIVYYHAKKELFDCLQSIRASKITTKYEVIVVDNDEKKTIEKEIKKEHPSVVYLKASQNKGFGAGNNLGAMHAKGEYLFFLNPDTKIFSHTIDKLTKFLDNNNTAAIVAPLLLDPDKKLYPLQGSTTLTPLNGILSLSFVNKLFPNNSVTQKYWLKGWDKTIVKEVDVVSGTAFMIRKKVYEEIDGFDEKFFLYFEENDLCKRVREKGYSIFITPNAQVIHLWGKGGTNDVKNIFTIFKKSRYYYFKKHFGVIPAIFTEAVMEINKYTMLLAAILVLSSCLLFYRLPELMSFIGDQGWFYLSARDIVLMKSFPLVGITASHPWLHQGAYWTYLLAFALWVFHFNPVSGAYLTSILGLVSVLLIYFAGKTYFSRRVGIIASFLYATSPLINFTSRMPYHTSPIPFFTLLFLLALYYWLKGGKYYFPLCIFLLAVLYNFELATATLGLVFPLIVLYGIWKKTEWLNMLRNKTVLFYSFLAWIVPMLPIIVYDVYHGFPQTVKFLAWIGYHILLFFGFPSIHPMQESISWSSMFSFIAQKYQMVIFAENSFVSCGIFLFTFGFFYYRFFQMIRLKKYHLGSILIGVMTILMVVGIVVNRTTSDAYLPVLFPFIILITAQIADVRKKTFFVPTVFLFLLVGILNTYILLKNTYFEHITFIQRVNIAKMIIKKSGRERYTIIGEGSESQFASFTMNYQYLTWWLGHGPSNKPEKVQFYIREDHNNVDLTERGNAKLR